MSSIRLWSCSGVVAANLAASSPGLALAFPAVMIVNATVFHVLPTLQTDGRFSPGLISAVMLSIRSLSRAIGHAARDGIGPAALIGSLVLGAD